MCLDSLISRSGECQLSHLWQAGNVGMLGSLYPPKPLPRQNPFPFQLPSWARAHCLARSAAHSPLPTSLTPVSSRAEPLPPPSDRFIHGSQSSPACGTSLHCQETFLMLQTLAERLSTSSSSLEGHWNSKEPHKVCCNETGGRSWEGGEDERVLLSVDTELVVWVLAKVLLLLSPSCTSVSLSHNALGGQKC